jgi:hypothetical protein
MERMFGSAEQQRAATAKIIESGKRAQNAGAAVGATETEQGCLDKGFAQEKSGPQEYARLMHFLEGCLQTAKPSPGFCDQVPLYRVGMSPDEEARSREYREALCRKESLSSRDCLAGVRMVQLHCHPLK